MIYIHALLRLRGQKCGYNNIIKKVDKSNSSNKCTCLHDGGIYSGRISHKNVLQVSKCYLNG